VCGAKGKKGALVWVWVGLALGWWWERDAKDLIDWSLDGDDMSQGTTARVVNMPFGSSVALENAAYVFGAKVHMYFIF
jgi:hypothetical protein